MDLPSGIRPVFVFCAGVLIVLLVDLCCCSNLVCVQCPDGASACWQLIVTGITGVNCTVANGTFTLLNLHQPTRCQWNSVETFEFADFFAVNQCVDLRTTRWILAYNLLADNAWMIRLFGAGAVVFVEYIISGTFDCLGTNTFNLQPPIDNACCANYPATLITTPMACP